jgi:TRAP-type C4-dicarboxylate transport system permease large subunit
MAIVYGAVGNVSIAGLFLGGATPGLMVGAGLMLYSYFLAHQVCESSGRPWARWLAPPAWRCFR